MPASLSVPIAFCQLLARQAAVRPDAVALQFEGQDTSYAQLAGRSERAAARLWHEWRVRPGDRVAWLGLNHPGQIVLLFALARLGAALLPLNFRLAPAEWDALLADCTPCRLVHDDTWAEAARELGARRGVAVHGLAELEAAHSFAQAPEPGRPDSPALLVCTSGSTGRPKAAVHTQGMLLANMEIASMVQDMSPADVVLTALPLFHVGGLCIQTLPALHAGACVVLHGRFSAQAVLDCIAHQRPSLTLQVPATMKALLDHPQWADTDLACLRAVWAGSSMLPAPLVAAFLARGVPLCNVYGATETGPFSIALPPAFAATHAGSCGWPAPGVEVKLAQEQGGQGELQVRGPNVVRHYWPQQAACDAQGWFSTGDLAARAQDGSYTVVGRARDLIISGGENIHPAEIESLLGEHPAVADCAAFGLADSEWGQVVAVAVVLKAGARLSDEAMREYLGQRLARFKLPRRVVRVAALPRTALGKLERHALAKLAGDL